MNEAEIAQADTAQKLFLVLGAFLLTIIGGITYLYSRKSDQLLSEERNRVEKTLLNILPKDTAEELQQKGYVEAKRFDQATVHFTDFKGFTPLAKECQLKKW